jgi:hypothetical protein
LQRRVGALEEDALHAGRRAAIFVALSWGVPLLLSLVQGHAFGPYDTHPYLLDFGAWARFFIATGLFLLAEQQVEYGLRGKLGQFVRAPILAPESFKDGETAVVKGQVQDDGAHVTLPGWLTVIFSVPIFYFLLMRGLWRYLVWASLLWRIASLKLRLVASHPDGKAGLGFIADYPNAYSMFVFGLSASMAITVVRHVFERNISSVTFGYIIAGWLAIVFAFFAFPLLAFSKPLAELKEKSLQILGAEATRFHRKTERAAIGRNILADDHAEADPDQPVADPSIQHPIAKKLTLLLMSAPAIAPLRAAALVPFAIAGATKLPYKEVFALVKKLLVL